MYNFCGYKAMYSQIKNTNKNWVNLSETMNYILKVSQSK